MAEKNAATGYVYRQVTAQDAFGNISAATMADGGQQGTYAYSARSGQMLSSVVKVGVTTLHHLNYTNYDSYGNIITQYNHGTGASQYDTFTYDALQRLTKSEVTMGDGTSVGIDYSYDTVGNLLKKTDYSINSNTAYTYNTGTNQVASVVLANNQTANFSYDNKGNQVSRTVGSSSPETFIYNVMNKPTQIQRFNATVNLFYDANWSRYKQVREVDGKTITTHYIDKLYEVEMDGNTTKATSYISDVAVLVEEGSRKTIRFTHRDRLGSATTFLDHNNRVTAYRYYDPFGKPRVGDGSLMREYGMSARLANNLLDSDMATRRGFTDHEHLDEVEIIHMNGRVYDYNLGRFLSVDPIIQGVGNSQGINPYSYVMNNPLAFTDPSGYCAAETGTRIKKCVDVEVTDVDTGETVTKSMNSLHSNFVGNVQQQIVNVLGNGAQIESMSATMKSGEIVDFMSRPINNVDSTNPEAAPRNGIDIQGVKVKGSEITSSQEVIESLMDWEDDPKTNDYARDPYKVGGEGNWTVGYGHEITDVEYESGFFHNITREQALTFLREDVAIAESRVKQFIVNNNSSFNPTQQQFDALVHLTFNTGYLGAERDGQLKFYNLVTSFQQGKFDTMMEHTLDITNGGMPGLVSRRLHEKDIYELGDYSGR